MGPELTWVSDPFTQWVHTYTPRQVWDIITRIYGHSLHTCTKLTSSLLKPRRNDGVNNALTFSVSGCHMAYPQDRTHPSIHWSTHFYIVGDTQTLTEGGTLELDDSWLDTGTLWTQNHPYDDTAVANSITRLWLFHSSPDNSIGIRVQRPNRPHYTYQ